MKEDTPLQVIQLYFIVKVVFLLIGIILFLVNIPHLSFLNFLFEDSALYNLSILLPILLIIGYLYCIVGFSTRSNLARITAIILCIINLIVFPFGTIVSGLIIIYLLFFEKGTFADIPKKNLPFRAMGSIVLFVAVVGLLFSVGTFSFVEDELGFGMPLTTAEKVSVTSGGTIDVIVQMRGIGSQAFSIQSVVTQDIVAMGGTVEDKTFRVLNAFRVEIDSDRLMELASNPNIVRIVENKRIVRIIDDQQPVHVTRLLDNSYSLLNVEPLWNQSITGKGIVIAVVDTGINEDISALQRNGKSVVIDSFELYGDYVHWHGTGIATCICSQDSIYKGVAPGVDILDVGVFSYSDGDLGASIWDIVDGWEWVANWKLANDRFVITSNSFGSDPPFDQGSILLADAANNMVEQYNIPMVCSAGNMHNPYPGSISSPAFASNSLCVGAVDDNLNIASFSCIGPGYTVDHKPDVVAPGHPVSMFDSSGSLVTASGTSFSAPLTAGVFALVAQGHESYSVSQFNRAFQRGAMDLGDSGYDYSYGYGMVDAEKTIDMLENEEPETSYMFIFGMLSFAGFGIVSYPEWRKRK